jgi:hypothetical protein
VSLDQLSISCGIRAISRLALVQMIAHCLDLSLPKTLFKLTRGLRRNQNIIAG